MKAYRLLQVGIILSLLYSCEKDPLPDRFNPTVFNVNISAMGNTTARLTNFNIDGGGYTSCGVLYGTSANPRVSSNRIIYYGASGIGITGLSPNTTYYYCGYAFDGDSYIYGDVKSFMTKNVSASVTTVSAVGNGYNSAYSPYSYRFNISVSLVGLNKVSEWGIMVSSSSNFSSYNKSAITVSDYIEGETFTQYWGAKTRTTYYCRAYAILTSGSYVYGSTRVVVAGD